MEPATCPNLETLVANWRTQAAQEESLGAEQLAELESHLLDAVDHLRELGLNDEEAFLVASRRLGQPQALAQEYRAADPALRWRKCLTWMLAGVILQMAIGVLSQLLGTVFQVWALNSLGSFPEALLWVGIVTGCFFFLLSFLSLRNSGQLLRTLRSRVGPERWQRLLLAASFAPLILMSVYAWASSSGANPRSISTWYWIPYHVNYPVMTILFLWSWRRTYGSGRPTVGWTIVE
jgi:hypothetical protein